MADQGALHKNVLRLGPFRDEPQGGGFHPSTGAQGSFERRLGSVLGLDFKLGYTRPDVAHREDFFVFTSQISVTTVAVDLLVHPLPPGKPVDWYLGLGVGYVAFRGPSPLPEDVASPVLRTGVDVQLGHSWRWAVGVDVEHLYTSSFDAKEGSADYSPIHYGAALSLRY